MAWTTPRTAIIGDIYTAAWYNLDTRDNLNYLKGSPGFDGSPYAVGEISARLAAAAQTTIGGVGATSEAGIRFGSAQDVVLYRFSSAILTTNATLALSGDVYTRWGSTLGQTVIGLVGANGGLLFGSAQDVNVYRAAADSLKTDDSFIAAIAISAGTEVTARTGAAGQVYIGAVGPSSAAAILFGSAADTNLYRSGADSLKTDDGFAVGGAIMTCANVLVVNSTDATPSGSAGKLFFGSAWDTNLYRSAADILKTDDSLEVGGAAGIKATNATGDIQTLRYSRVGTAAVPTANVDKGLVLSNSTADTPNNPVGGAFMWAFAGALKARGSSGTQVVVCAAEPHCPECGRDFVLSYENDDYGRLTVCVWCMTEGMAAGVIERTEP